jgi:putative FmdB family regulatory protein
MPLYAYQCTVCGRDENRVTGIDDSGVTCTECGGLMLRTTADADLYRDYRPRPERAGLNSGSTRDSG